MDTERQFMLAAIEEARRSQPEDDTPRPKVGVIIVKDGHILARAHRGEGSPGRHAEYVALEHHLQDDVLAGATVFTTLEPCTKRNHPKIACAKRLIERRVKRVVIGMLDPNPDIVGKGCWLLRDAGIEVQLFDSDMMADIEDLNRDFVRHQKQKWANQSTEHSSSHDDNRPLPANRLLQRTPRDSKPNAAAARVCNNRLTCLEIDSNTGKIITGGFDGALYSIDSKTGEIESLAVSDTIVRDIVSAEKGLTIAADDHGQIWLVNTGPARGRVEIGRAQSSIFSLTWRNQPGVLITAERNGMVSEWRLNLEAATPTAQHLRVIHRHEGPAFGVSFVGQQCKSVGADGLMRSCDISSGHTEQRPLSSNAIFALAANAGMTVIGDSGGKLQILRPGATNSTQLDGHGSAVRNVDISPGSNWVVSGGKDGTVRLWHVSTLRTWIVAVADDYIYDVKFGLSGSHAVACDGSGAIIQVDFGSPIDQLTPTQIEALFAY